MRIATTIAGSLIQCTKSTSRLDYYSCPLCEEEVIPCNELTEEQGRIKDYYFSHQTSCPRWNPETYLHILAKKIIINARLINCPDGELSYVRAVEEDDTFCPGIVPDIVLDSNFIIEIYFSNKKSAAYVSVLKKENRTAMEINLSKMSLGSSLKELEDSVLYSAERHYLFKRRERNGLPWGIWLLFGTFGIYILRRMRFLCKKKNKRRRYSKYYL